MKLYPRLHQTQLLARQVAGKNLTVSETNGCLKFGVFGVNVRKIVMLIVDQVKSNDDAVERSNSPDGGGGRSPLETVGWNAGLGVTRPSALICALS